MTGAGSAASVPFWERSETVERFAARDPDHRLRALVNLYPGPSRVRVLDLGCAGGRNTVFLSALGFDVMAMDASSAMVEETRRRLVPLVGSGESSRRVRRGKMDRLSGLKDASVDLIVALGIYQSAASRKEWDRALAESSRVLARGGRILVATHTHRFDPEGKGLVPVPGEPNLYDGMDSGRAFLVDAPGLDLEMMRRGLVPLVPTYTVERATEAGGRRVTANGLFEKR